MKYYLKGGLGNQIFQLLHIINNCEGKVELNTCLLNQYQTPREFDLQKYFSLDQYVSVVGAKSYSKIVPIEKLFKLFNRQNIVNIRCDYFQNVNITKSSILKIKDIYKYKVDFCFENSLLIHLRLTDFISGDYLAKLNHELSKIKLECFDKIYISSDAEQVPELSFLEGLEYEMFDIDFSTPSRFKAIFTPCSTYSLWYGLLTGSPIIQPDGAGWNTEWTLEEGLSFDPRI